METGNNIQNPEVIDAGPRIKKRSGWAAFFFTYLCTGLGHLYCGKIKKAVFFYVSSLIIFSFLLSFLKFRPSIYVLLSVILISLPYSIFIYVDAIRTARREKEYRIKKFNRWYVYIAIIVAQVIINYPLGFLNPKYYKNPTGSMQNTILVGDRLFANDLAYGIYNPIKNDYLIEFSEPKRNDVIAFNFPGFRDEVKPKDEVTYTKRIIGEPGDRIEISGNNLYVNDVRFRFPETANLEIVYNLGSTADKNVFPKGSGWSANNYGPIEVPKQGDMIFITPENIEKWKVFIEREENNVEVSGEKILVNGVETSTYKVKRNYYFVIGDNFDNSIDSRYFGFVSKNDILSKLTMVYWSWDNEIPFSQFGRLFESTRWNRIGKLIE